MKPMTTGIIAACAVIVAFVAGMMIEAERDTPLENVAEAVESAGNDLKDSVKDATN